MQTLTTTDTPATPAQSCEPSALPEHVGHIVRRSAELRSDHDQESTRGQKRVDRVTSLAGRPASVAIVTAVIVAWIALNLGLQWSGRKPWDEPPFFWMQGTIALAALYMTLLILATQRREDELSRRRDDLTLQLSSLSEEKAAKIIELLEALRRDSTAVANREDPEANEMANAADPKAVYAVIKADDEARGAR